MDKIFLTANAFLCHNNVRLCNNAYLTLIMWEMKNLAYLLIGTQP